MTTPRFRLLKKCLRFLRWAAISFGLLCVLTFGAAYIFCYWKNDTLTRYIVATLERNTGFSWRVQGEVRPSLIPPGIAVGRIALVSLSERTRKTKTQAPLIMVERLVLEPDMRALLRGELLLQLVQVEKPVVRFSSFQRGAPASNATVPAAGTPNATAAIAENTRKNALPDQETTEAEPQETSLPEAEEVHSPEENAAEALHQAARVVRQLLNPANMGKLPELHVQGGKIFYDSGSAQGMDFQELRITLQPRNNTPSVALSGRFTLPGEALEVSLQLEATPGTGEELVRATVQTALSITPHGSRPLHASMATTAIWRGNGLELFLPDLQVEAEKDGITASILAQLHQGTAQGTVQVDNLSLPRWFVFGRNLPPALQQALHAIHGTFDVSAENNGIFTKNMRLYAGEIPVTGQLYVANLRKPAVEADLHLAYADADTLFPFLAAGSEPAQTPLEPTFDHPPLVPYPERPLAPGEVAGELVDVGYDIRITGEQGKVHGLQGGSLFVRVHPQHGLVTRVSFTVNNLANGTGSGFLDIDHHLVIMHFETQRTELAFLPENEGSSVQVGGLLSGVFTMGIDVNDGTWAPDWRFTARAGVENFSVKAGGGTWGLGSRTITATHEGKIHAVRKNGIRIEGNWNAAATGFAGSWNPGGNDNLTLALNGAVAWPPKGDTPNPAQQGGIQSVSGAVQANGVCTVRLGRLLTPLAGKLHGTMAWNIHNDTFGLQNYEYTGLESSIKGSLQLDYSKDMRANGEQQFSIGLRHLLSQWELLPGEGIILPERITGKTTVTLLNDTLALDPLQLEMNGGVFEGSVTNVSEASQWRAVSRLTLPDKRGNLLLNPTRFVFQETKRTGKPFSAIKESYAQLSPYSLRQAAQDIGFTPNEGATAPAPQRQTGPKKIIPAPPQVQKAAQSQKIAKNAKGSPAKKTRPSPLRAGRSNRALSPSYWILDIRGSLLNLDTFMRQNPPGTTPPAPSKEPFDWSFLDDLNVDARLVMENVIFQKVQAKKSEMGLRLGSNKFAFQWESHNFYQGKSLFTGTGFFVQPSQIGIESSTLHAQNFQLQPAMQDVAGQAGYGGEATLDFSLHGAMRSPADLPGGLSGVFALGINNGMYPAFMGSQSLGLRNTFSTANITGTMQNGVLHSQEFTLSGLMIDMAGNGWVDLQRRMLDITVNVTLARVPTLPVRFSGSFDAPTMSVNGVQMVLGTAEAAGGAVFSLIRGVLELPARAIMGVGSIMNQPQSGKNTPATAPAGKDTTQSVPPAPKQKR